MSSTHTWLSYREAGPADTEALLALGRLAYGTHAAVLGAAHAAEMDRRLADRAALEDLMSYATAFVAVQGRRLAGMAFYVPSGHPSAFFSADWCSLRRLAVHPALRGRGIARELVSRCIARAAGQQTMALYTGEFMRAARALYEDMGFVQLRRIDNMFGQPYWLYVLDLRRRGRAAGGGAGGKTME